MSVDPEPSSPQLSILLLCWNHAPYLERCIGGLAAQDLAGVEIMFLDNGSSDGSVALAESLFKRFGIEHIAFAALVEGRDGLAGMDDDVGRR